MVTFNEKNVFAGRARLRARDIRAALDGRNIDTAIIHTFEGLADNDKTQRDQIEALADHVNNLMDLVNKLVFIIESVKDKVPDLQQLSGVANVLAVGPTSILKKTAQDAIKSKKPEET